ncbi:MAG: tetratricopeptide repeat protein [Pseudomonadota bacterium]
MAKQVHAQSADDLEECFDRGQPWEVISSCSRALEADGWKDEQLFHLHYIRALAYNQMGEHFKAIDDYNQAIELFPVRGLAYHSIGVSFEWIGNYRQAVESYGLGIAIDPKYPGNYLARIRVSCMFGTNIDLYDDITSFFSVLTEPKFLREIQTHLEEIGLYEGPIDGEANQATIEAFRRMNTLDCLTCREGDCEIHS